MTNKTIHNGGRRVRWTIKEPDYWKSSVAAAWLIELLRSARVWKESLVFAWPWKSQTWSAFFHGRKTITEGDIGIDNVIIITRIIEAK